jgi:hypothetical protein
LISLKINNTDTPVSSHIIGSEGRSVPNESVKLYSIEKGTTAKKIKYNDLKLLLINIDPNIANGNNKHK